MTDPSVLSYIRSMLLSGHSLAEVEQILVSRGYTPQQAREAVLETYSQQPSASVLTEPHHKHPILLVILLVMMICVVGVVIYIVFPPHAMDSSSLDFSLSMQTQPYTYGTSISVNRVVSFSSDSNPVRITYSVRNSQGAVIHTFYETVFVSTTSPSVSFRLPTAVLGSGGQFSLEAVAQRGTSKSIQTAQFLVAAPSVTTPVLSNQSKINDSVKNGSSSQIAPEKNGFVNKTSSGENSFNKANCVDGIKNGDEEDVDCGGSCYPCIRQCPLFIDDNNACTQDLCGADTHFKVFHKDVIPCCGNRICEPSESFSDCSLDCKEKAAISYFEQTPISDSLNTTASITQYIDQNAPLEDQIEDVLELSYTDFSQAEKLCLALTLPYYRDDCLYQLVSTHGTASVCNLISDSRTADKCYTKLSVFHNETSYCGSIASSVRRDSCYMRFALNGNYAVCDMIDDDYYIQTCRQLRELHANTASVSSSG